MARRLMFIRIRVCHWKKSGVVSTFRVMSTYVTTSIKT